MNSSDRNSAHWNGPSFALRCVKIVSLTTVTERCCRQGWRGVVTSPRDVVDKGEGVGGVFRVT